MKVDARRLTRSLTANGGFAVRPVRPAAAIRHKTRRGA